MKIMRTTHGTFDGQVLRLEDVAGLETNRRYRITLEEEAAPTTAEEQAVEDRFRPLMDIANEMGIADFAEKHLKK
jgi:hypothetical protein